MNIPKLPDKVTWVIFNNGDSIQPAVLLNAFWLVPVAMGANIEITSLSVSSYPNFIKLASTRQLDVKSVKIIGGGKMLEYCGNGVQPYEIRERDWGNYNDTLTEFIAWGIDVKPGEKIYITLEFQ